MVKVIHNNNCSKSRGILEYLDEHGVPFEVIDMVNEPLSGDEIRTVLKKLNMKPVELLRTTEKKYLDEFAGKDFYDEEWIKILADNPELIQRPILIKGPVAMIGRPIENVAYFLVD